MEKCHLEGVWLPALRSKWRNGFPHAPMPQWHAYRANMPQTKLTFDEYGRGEGWVGESYVHHEVTQICTGRYCSIAYVKHVWVMGDGNLTILPDTGILEMQFPSEGVKEYWQRKDGRNIGTLEEAKAGVKSKVEDPNLNLRHNPSRALRPVRLIFTRNPKLGITWHWGLSVGEFTFEVVAGKDSRLAVLGPRVIVTSSLDQKIDPQWKRGTSWRTLDGFVRTGNFTNRTDAEIEEECKLWVHKHPIWKASSPNCQTFSEHLFKFLTGEELRFEEVANLILGPTKHAPVVWLRDGNKPGDFAVENLITRWYQG